MTMRSLVAALLLQALTAPDSGVADTVNATLHKFVKK